MSRPDAAPRKSARRFALRVILVIAVIVVAVYLLLLSDTNRVLKWRLDRLHSKGIPTNWSAVVPPPIPGKDNAAILYARAFSLIRVEHEEWKALDKIFRPDWRARRTQPQKVDLKQLAQIVARNQPALDLVRQAAAKPRCRFPINWSDRSYEIFLPNCDSVRSCALLVAAEGLTAAAQGDVPHAVDCYRTMLRMANHASSDPTRISFLAGVHIQRLAIEGITRLIQSRDLDPATCRALFDELQAIDLDATLQRSMAGEGCMVFRLFDQAEKQPWPLREAFMREAFRDPSGHGSLLTGVAADIYFSPLGKLARLKEEIAFTEHYEKGLALTAQPYREGASAWHAVEEEQSTLASYYLISSGQDPFYSPRIVVERDKAVASRNALQVALALKAYRAERGAYPDSLDTLRSAGWTLPGDPFSGKPFVYHRFGPGFILYSWGQDLDDDRGRPVDPRRNPSNPTDGDTVWSFPK